MRVLDWLCDRRRNCAELSPIKFPGGPTIMAAPHQAAGLNNSPAAADAESSNDELGTASIGESAALCAAAPGECEDNPNSKI